jgi:zinc protease
MTTLLPLSLALRRVLTRASVTTALALLVVVPVHAQEGATSAPASETPPASFEKVATVEGITEYRLDNGLRVLLFPDASKATTTVNITYLVGSGHEGYGETGMAHLLEHMLFKGTPDHPDIPQELTERGARPNGTTWFDRTNYFETFEASVENLEWALDLEADRMVNSFVAAEDLSSEMTVVRNEFESGENNPFGVLMKRTVSAAFQWHNYGNSTIGARSDIENVPIERLEAFYRKYYQPDNAVLVVAGNFDEARALELVEEKFGVLPRPDRSGEMQIYPLYTREPVQDGERSVTVRRTGDVQRLMAVYHVPAGAHEDFAAVDLLGHVLGSEPSGRLYEALVEPGLAASVNAFAYRLRDPGVLIVSAEVREEDPLEEARAALLETVEGLTENPPTEEEVERARAALLRQIQLTLNDSERVGLQLSEWASAGDWRLLFLHRDRLEEVPVEDVGRVAARYLKPSNRTLGVFIPTDEPDRAEIPATPDVASLVEDYRGGEGALAGEAFDPTPENLEARVERSELPSGFEVALLPRATRGERVVGRFTLRLGTEESLAGRRAAADLSGAMLMRGTENRTRQEIQDELDQLQSSLNVSGSATQVNGRFESTRGSLAGVLEIVQDVLRNPAFDSVEFARLKEERLAALEGQKSEPTALGSRRFSREMNPWPADHPRYTPTVEEEIAAVEATSLDDVRSFYETFYGADAGDAAVVGAMEAGEVAAVLEETFGAWQAEMPFERIPGPYRDVGPTDVEIETPDKANAFYLTGTHVEVRDDDPDHPAVTLGNFMLGGGFLNSRLATRIRQEEGLSYGVGSQFSAHPIDRNGTFAIYAIYAPQNKARLEAAVEDVLRETLEEGFTAEEVEAAKEGWLRSRRTSRADDASVAGMLASQLYLDRTFAWDQELESKVAGLTPEDVRAALERHLDPDSLVVVKAGDFAGAATAIERDTSTNEEDP